MKQLISWQALEFVSMGISTVCVWTNDYEQATYFILGAIWCYLKEKEDVQININNNANRAK